ncbi:uncharacterized protein [Oscarella lobularis]|uniref:uncharacterized protein isoform X2 n=1 Tax=Oscarella lobularis TaxID=121494 RepID=UPI0033136588
MGTATRAGVGSSPRRSLAYTNRTAREKHRKPDRSRLIALIVATVWLFDSAARANAIDIIIRPDRVDKGTDTRVDFECVGATGKIRWKFNGIEYKGDGAGPGSADGPSKRILHDPDIADGGRYACSTDQEGESDEKTLFVYTVPVISSPPQNESVHVGQDAKFSALIENFYGKQNRLLVLWQRDGGGPSYSQFVNGTSHGVVNVTYTVKNASSLDNTTFRFALLASYFPTLEEQFRLTVWPLTVVTPPSNLMFPPDNITNSSFKLTWFYQVGSEPIDKFTFHYGSSSPLQEKEAGPRSFSLTFTGLSSCTTYEIYGIAVGTMGQVSDKSDVVSVTTGLTPLEDSQIWSDGDRVIVHYEGKSLRLCVTNNLTYHHQAAKLCSLAAKLPSKSGKGGATSAFQTEMTFTTESSSFRSLLQSCLHEEKSGCTGNGKLISLRDLCPTPSTKGPTIAPDKEKFNVGAVVAGAIVGIIIIIIIIVIVVIWRKRLASLCKKRKRPQQDTLSSRHVALEHDYEDVDSSTASVNHPSDGQDEKESNQNGTLAVELGTPPERMPEPDPSPSRRPLLPDGSEKQTAATSQAPPRVSGNGQRRRLSLRGGVFHRQTSLASGKSPSTEKLNSPMLDSDDEGCFEPERKSCTKEKKESPRGSLESHSVDHTVDIHVSSPQDNPQETNIDEESKANDSVNSLQEHNTMYEVLRRIKGMQQQVDELVGKQDEDARESRESFKKIVEEMQRQFQEVLQRRITLFPVQRHARRNSEPPLPSKSKFPSPPKQRVMYPIPSVMPATPSFEAGTAPKQGKTRSERQQGSSQSSISSLSVGDIQRRLDGLERKLESALKMMSRLEGKMATKNNQESILEELTEIWSCVENIATEMLEKASIAGSSISEEPDREDKRGLPH